MSETIAVTVKLFAIYREMLGESEITTEVTDNHSVADLFGDLLGEQAAPALRDATMFAVNETYVPADTVLCAGDRVAFIPPVSGG
jgi:molybdopterin converting factor subunit 1